jgi:carbamoyl-phosphate synthase large subunit
MSEPSPRTWNIAVTGLNATDNPGPGVGVMRALRHAPEFEGLVIGLAYDSLEPGIYARDIVDQAFLIPYPSQGPEALEERLRYIHERTPLDVIIPTLDSEMLSFIELQPVLRELGIGLFVPTREQFELRSKAHLDQLARRADIRVPRTRVLADASELADVHEDLGDPYVIKGAFYGAAVVRGLHEATLAYHEALAHFGPPIIAQEYVRGDEFDVVAVGDGHGGLIGAVPMRKTSLTDKGKGWSGIAIKDPELLAITERFMRESRWRGPCEVEIMKSRAGEYFLMEINPRFPAWCFLSAGAGLNLPWAVARLAAAESVAPMRDFRVGTMFVRISIDQLAELGDFEQMATTGELLRRERSEKHNEPKREREA